MKTFTPGAQCTFAQCPMYHCVESYSGVKYVTTILRLSAVICRLLLGLYEIKSTELTTIL